MQIKGAPSIQQNETIVSTLAMVAAVCVGEGSFVIMPFLVSVISEHLNFSTGAAALVISFQFVFMAITSALISRIVHRIDRRRLLLIAGGLIFLANGLAISFTSSTWFLLSRACMGIGEGTALSIGYALAAGTKQPHRAFSIVTFGMVATATPMYLSVPYITAYTGPLAVYYVLILLAFLCYPFLLGVHARPAEITVGEKGVSADNNHLSIWRPFPWILVAVCFLYISNNTLWAFSERVGSSIGLNLKTISNTFLATVIIALLGPLAAHLAHKKWAYVRPLFAAVVIQVTAIFALVYAANVGVYVVSVILINTLSMFLVPYYRGLTAFLDPGGRLASATVISQTIATSIGPFIGGTILLAGGGYAAIGWVAAFFTISSLLLIFSIATKAEKTFNFNVRANTEKSKNGYEY